MAPQVDVILPTHRRPHTVALAMRSVLLQTHTDLRLHVVGDGCDASTEAAVRSVADSRVSWYSFPKAHGFGYENRNTVLRQTSGRLIAYMTDDDLWFPDHLERAITALGDTPGLVAMRSCLVHYPDVLDPYFFAFDWRNPLAVHYLRHWFMGAVSCVHDRRVFDEVGLWNGRLTRFGDREFYNRVRGSAVPSRCTNDTTVLRFYALHWDHRYRSIATPPQEHFLDRLQDQRWCEDIRHAVGHSRRSLAVRRQQWSDFARFAVASGPKFVRFHYERAVRPVAAPGTS